MRRRISQAHETTSLFGSRGAGPELAPGLRSSGQSIASTRKDHWSCPSNSRTFTPPATSAMPPSMQRWCRWRLTVQPHVAALTKTIPPASTASAPYAADTQPLARVGVGGDIFNNSRPALVTRKFLSLARELAGHRQAAFVFGQSLPPSCRGLALRYLSRVFRQLSSVTVRDEESAAAVAGDGREGRSCHSTRRSCSAR